MKKSSLLYKIINGIWDMCYIWKTEMRNVFRDEGVLIFCILVPLGYPLLYSWIYNNEVVREVDTAIVDLSHSHTSREFIRDYDASPDVKATYYCNSLDEAKQLVQRQAVHGIVYIPADFDTKLNRGEQAHVGVYCDMSLMLTYKAIYQTSQAVASHINSGIQITQAGGFTDRDDEITTEPLAFDEVPIFNTTGGYGNAILPAVLVLILQQTMLLGIGMAAGTSRELNRNRELIPVSEHYGGIFRIVFGKALVYFMVYAVMGMYLALVVPKLFGFVSMVTWTTILGFLLQYLVMMTTLGSNLWQMSDGEYLSVLESHFFHDICHLFSYLAAYSGINLIKDDGWQLHGSTDHCLQREHHTGNLTTRSNLTDRLQLCTFVGTEEEADLIGTIS